LNQIGLDWIGLNRNPFSSTDGDLQLNLTMEMEIQKWAIEGEGFRENAKEETKKG
jgi:hypothetical protein